MCLYLPLISTYYAAVSSSTASAGFICSRAGAERLPAGPSAALGHPEPAPRWPHDSPWAEARLKGTGHYSRGMYVCVCFQWVSGTSSTTGAQRVPTLTPPPMGQGLPSPSAPNPYPYPYPPSPRQLREAQSHHASPFSFIQLYSTRRNTESAGGKGNGVEEQRQPPTLASGSRGTHSPSGTAGPSPFTASMGRGSRGNCSRGSIWFFGVPPAPQPTAGDD